MFCTGCGHVIQAEWRFCGGCGAKVAVPAVQSGLAVSPSREPPAKPVTSVSTAPAPAHEPPVTSPTKNQSLAAFEPAGAWRRFWARLIDISLFSVPVLIAGAWVLNLMVPGFADWFAQPQADKILAWLLLPATLFLEWFAYELAGTTPGKALFGLRVTDVGGQKIGGNAYFNRQVRFYLKGIWTGIPLISLGAIAGEHSALKKTGSATYDRDQHRVEQRVFGAGRFFLATAGVVTLVFAMAMSDILSRALEGGQAWRNPETGREVMIGSQWSAAANANGDTTFTSADGKHQVFMSVHADESEPGLRTAAEFFRRSMLKSTDLGEFKPYEGFAGRPAVIADGVSRDGAEFVRMIVGLTASDHMLLIYQSTSDESRGRTSLDSLTRALIRSGD